MINPAWPEIAKAAPANLHHQMGHDRGNAKDGYSLTLTGAGKIEAKKRSE